MDWGVAPVEALDPRMPHIRHGQATCRTYELARDLPHGQHRVKVIHRSHAGEVGCRVSGFRVLGEDTSESRESPGNLPARTRTSPILSLSTG